MAGMQPPKFSTQDLARQANHFLRSRAGQASLGIAGVVVLGTAIAAAANSPTWKPQAVATTPLPTATAIAQPTEAPTAAEPTAAPAQTPSRLNGMLADSGTENRRPLAVMIENHPQARPQAGLGQADIVYEAIAEGGITRFMAVFGNPQNDVRVGPVRSARPYYVDFAKELDALYAHAGGSIDGLARIRELGLPDLDGLSIGGPVFTRDRSRRVSSEHTLYSSTRKLWDYATGKAGHAATATIDPWQFTDDAPADQRPDAQKVSASVSAPLYAVVWTYDKESNTYKRAMAGSSHVDAGTGAQIAVKNVILQTAVRTGYLEHYGKITKPVNKYALTGSGNALVFQNGQTVKATWKKEGTGRTRYYDASGNEIKLVRGRVWVQLVEGDSKISY